MDYYIGIKNKTGFFSVIFFDWAKVQIYFGIRFTTGIMQSQ
ncbi:hypothetical protein ADICYQ_5396 [Cyclobacterium qasimii M12-11B]|uniref:Uncharacterized protein n=1 Tax=Cyclobacterium qasimii M12-11B TaxID=641524 RepID=S7V5N4_9BACT|nr:hypothetical protein ADICYQ_5396 [Cyclobacterium qasimii M12-11B]